MKKIKLIAVLAIVLLLSCSKEEETPEVIVDTTRPIWIIGDSTVSDYDDNEELRGWGQVIKAMFKNSSRVDNRARSGASSKSFKLNNDNFENNDFWGDGTTKNVFGLTGLKEDILNSDTSKGGYLFIQFGHNDIFYDEYIEELTTVPGVGNEFDDMLMEYISFAKANNITPILVTPMARMYIGQTDDYRHTAEALLGIPDAWSAMEGKKGDWPQTMKDIAKRENLILLDLTTTSVEHFGTFESNQAIKDMYSWDKNDATHFNEKGAKKMAEFIVELACDTKNGGDAELCAQFEGH